MPAVVLSGLACSRVSRVALMMPRGVAPVGVLVRNPAFDVTPSELVTAIITEKGAFRTGDIHMLRPGGSGYENLRVQGDF